MEGITLYSLLPLVGSLFVILLGFFVWSKNLKSLIYFLFFAYSFTISLWLFGTFKLFNAGSDVIAIFWDRFIYIGVVLIPIFLFHFGLLYCGILKQRTILFWGYIIALFFLPISQTIFFTDGLFKYQWGLHTRAGLFHHFFLVYFFFYFIFFFVNLFKHYRKSEGLHKKQVKFILTGFFILDLIGPLAFLPAYGIPIYPVIFLSAIPFVLLLAYGIIKYKALDLRVISTEVFCSLLVLLFLSEIFFARSTIEYFLRLGSFVGVVFFVILLIKSVRNEVNRREEIQKLNIELQDTVKKLGDATDKLKKQNEELKKLDELKTEFISIASHQLRTPLTAMKWGLEFLSSGKKGKLTKDEKETIDDLTQTNTRLIKLVNELLNISRLDEGRLRVDPKPTNLSELIQSCLNDFNPMIEQKKLKVIEHYEKLPKIRLDESVISKALVNILSNAIKYSRDGKKLTIQVQAQKSDILISIQDEGIGIPKNDQQNLFKKFYRGSNAVSYQTEGNGLGLYIAKSAIELSGGKVWFESQENVGTTFFISIPLSGSKPIKGEKSLS